MPQPSLAGAFLANDIHSCDEEVCHKRLCSTRGCALEQIFFIKTIFARRWRENEDSQTTSQAKGIGWGAWDEQVGQTWV